MFVKKSDNCDFTFFIQGDIIKNTQRYKNTEMHFVGYFCVKDLIIVQKMEHIKIINLNRQKLHNFFYYLP
jgi:hypothetical protein